MKVKGVGSHESMINSQLESCGSLTMVIFGFFRTCVFSSRCCLPPQGMIVARRVINQNVIVGKTPRDPIIGVELLHALPPLILPVPHLIGLGPGHTLLVSCRVYQLQPITVEGQSSLSCEGPCTDIIE